MNPFTTTPFCTGYKHNSELVRSYWAALVASAPPQSLLHCSTERHKELLKPDPVEYSEGKKVIHQRAGKTKQQTYWLRRNDAGLLVLSPGTAG